MMNRKAIKALIRCTHLSILSHIVHMRNFNKLVGPVVAKMSKHFWRLLEEMHITF